MPGQIEFLAEEVSASGYNRLDSPSVMPRRGLIQPALRPHRRAA